MKAEEARLRAELKPTATRRTYKEQQSNRERLAAIREWAAASGIEVPARGRLPQKVLDQYAAAVK